MRGGRVGTGDGREGGRGGGDYREWRELRIKKGRRLERTLRC
jgi:hypothetical protein